MSVWHCPKPPLIDLCRGGYPGRMPGQTRSGATGGFTLVELLIALGLTGLVAVALLAAARVQTTLQRQEQQAQQTQDNVRSSVEELVHSLHQAMSGVAANAVPPGTPATISGVTVLNNVLGAANGDSPDTLQLVLNDDSVVAALLQDAGPGTQPIVVNTGSAFRSNDFFTLTDFNKAILCRLTVDPQAGTANGLDVGQLWMSGPLPVSKLTFLRGSLAVRARLLAYQINTTLFSGTPLLTLQDGAPLDTTKAEEIVAENIEDLQIAVGVDGLHTSILDGTIQEVGAAVDDDEWVYNYPGETMPDPLPPVARISAVRISVVGRTTQAGELLGPGRPAVEDRPAGPPDHYRWRVLTVRVSLRPLATN